MRLLILALLGVAGAASAESRFPDYPVTAFVMPENKDRSHITIECSPEKEFPPQIRCNFRQTHILYDKHKEGLAESIAKEKKAVIAELNKASELKKLDALCKELGAPKAKEAQAKKIATARTEYEKQISIKAGEAWAQACAKGTKEAYATALLALTEMQQTQATETCVISSHDWSETFSYKITHGESYWVATGEPAGECGAVNVSTLKGGKFLWDYESQRIITNQSGEAFLLKCKDLDQGVKRFTWQRESVGMDCRFIKFMN